jgi:glycerol-3-phosphate acyltransferase PlsY
MLFPALAVLLSYLVGSIPWGLVLVRIFKGEDLRKHGSGNIGATNAIRAAGKPIGLAVFLLDFAKGTLVMWGFVPFAAPEQGPLGWLAVSCGAATVLGHCFPVWLGFKGGKGVATGCGALVGFDWKISAVGGLVFFTTLFTTRFVSVASIVMGLSFVPAAWFVTQRVEPTVGAALLALLILVRHRSNIARMLAGTEPKAFTKRAGESEQGHG